MEDNLKNIEIDEFSEEVSIKELDLKELGLEALEVSTDTMLEEMGASLGLHGCCSVSVN